MIGYYVLACAVTLGIPGILWALPALILALAERPTPPPKAIARRRR